MWWIVNLPNGTQQAIKLDSKAIGQECLEKVCKALGIICEMEYFGLEYWSPNQEESRTRQWINLRNRLSCDSSSNGIQPMLALRVKFWVPVYCLLQESVRNIFYTQAKSDLLEGRLKALDWKNSAKLAALMCQSDGIRFNKLSLKSEVDMYPKEGHLQNSNQNHQDKHCDRRDREYVFYFKKRRLSKQKSFESIENSPTERPAPTSGVTELPTNSIKCKPHTGMISYFTNTTSANGGNNRRDSDAELEPSLETTIAANPLRVYQDYIVYPVDDVNCTAPHDFLRQIAVEHEKLSLLDMSPKSAKYWLLEQIMNLPGYGEEIFSGVTGNENSMSCDVTVGTHSITTSIDNEKNTIPFGAVAAAKSFRRTFKLEYFGDYNERRELEIKFLKHSIAAGLYRSITERHAFYVCDKVRGVVTNQFTRDLKGTIASMFKEDTELGKRYVFDIQHTCREVHDQARRILHERGIEISAQSMSGSAYMDMLQSRTFNHDDDKTTAGPCQTIEDKLEQALQEREEREAVILKSVEARVSEAMTCKVCMDREINTMFSPCCHVTVCAQCAARCTHCPNCRVKIERTVKVYLPPELRKSVTLLTQRVA